MESTAMDAMLAASRRVLDITMNGSGESVLQSQRAPVSPYFISGNNHSQSVSPARIVPMPNPFWIGLKSKIGPRSKVTVAPIGRVRGILERLIVEKKPA